MKICRRILSILFVSLLCGCGANQDTLFEAELKPSPAPAYLTDTSVDFFESAATADNITVHIEPRVRYDGLKKIIYPYVYSTPSAELINETVSSTIDLLLHSSKAEMNTDYSIEYNNYGFISILLHLYNPDDYVQYEIYPLTFDTKSGELYTIADLFGSNVQWRWRLPDIVSAHAEQNEITLLSSPMPIGDDQSFYLSNTSLVLVYRYYEIATYAAGIPQFPIPFNELSEFADEDAPIFGLLPSN